VSADEPSNNDHWVPMGRIVGAYGIKGWIRVFSYTDPREGILDYRSWWLGEDRQAVNVIDGRRQGKAVVASLESCNDRDKAAALIDLEIAVPRSAMPDLDADQFYFSDLEGCQVEDRTGKQFGTVDTVLETGANDVLVVRGDTETLIPFVMGDTVLSVDVAAKQIVVDWDYD